MPHFNRWCSQTAKTQVLTQRRVQPFRIRERYARGKTLPAQRNARNAPMVTPVRVAHFEANGFGRGLRYKGQYFPADDEDWVRVVGCVGRTALADARSERAS